MDNTLLRYLDNHTKGKVYAGKIREITPIISDWLAYTVQTFPHYTRHTIKHSERIIEALSLLLFKEPSATEPTIPLSAIEAYILVCAAYLHDAGMVISDRDKKDILESEEWRKWVSDGSGAERYKKLSEFKDKNIISLDIEKYYFSYNIELRFLIAEFVRRQHHIRSGNIVELSSKKMGGFDFNDPSLRKTIADICVAHGLDASDLNDEDRYPERRTINGEQVNVKLLSVLFRIGDLLDMSSDRACPSLTAAANPIPPDSMSHWEQYTNIIHRLTSPDLIEVRAKCKSQDEHRTLQNWCSWIKSECDNASTIVPHMSRHNEWKVPNVKIDIQPSEDATYIAEDWKFIFDEEKIVRRLIQDIHSHGLGFLNELIQNALDATRCKLYNDLNTSFKATPPNPWQVPDEIRQNYPLKIIISKEKKNNRFLDKEEDVLVVTVEDCGIGMSKNVVINYFLQMGRSYYTSPEFSKQYSFQPISRYGIGFLSVFSNSNHVEVETYNGIDLPLKMTLEGPKNYLLLENSIKTNTGTIVKVYLDNWNHDKDIVSYIKDMCIFVEFPIFLEHFGDMTSIVAETPQDLTYQLPDVTKTENEFILKSFPILTEKIYGSLYVLAYKTPKGEDWTELYYAKYKYPKLVPNDLPVLPEDIVCINGLCNDGRSYGFRDDNKIVRVDIRSKIENLSLDKRGIDAQYGRVSYKYIPYRNNSWKAEIEVKWMSILEQHLKETSTNKTSEERWHYLQGLPSRFPMNDFWDRIDGTIKAYQDENERYLSIREWEKVDIFTTYRSYRPKRTRDIKIRGYWLDVSLQPSEYFRQQIFKKRFPISVEENKENELIIWQRFDEIPYVELYNWIKKSDQHMYGANSLYICPLSPNNRLSLATFRTHDGHAGSLLLNWNHPFIKWMINLCNSLKDLDNRSMLLENGVKVLFKNHFTETIFSRRGISNEDLENLKYYVDKLEKLPDFPNIEKAPINQLMNDLESRYRYFTK